MLAGNTPVLVHNCGGGSEASPKRDLYRADTRTPDEMFGGFHPKGTNMDHEAHVFSNPSDSGYISTSDTRGAAEEFAHDNYLDDAHIYHVRGNGIDVNATFGARSPFPHEREISVPGSIATEDIVGAWSPGGDWIPNPGFRP